MSNGFVRLCKPCADDIVWDGGRMVGSVRLRYITNCRFSFVVSNIFISFAY